MKRSIVFLVIWGLVFTAYADELYKVKKGDTLWDICNQYYHNPYLWPKLWQINPQIPNPHWIYPGDVVKLKETPEALIQATTKKPKVVPKPKRLLGAKIVATVGYVLPQKEAYSGNILRAKVDANRTILGKGDKIFIQFKTGVPVSTGSQWTIFRIESQVRHPITHQVVGYLHRVLGVVKITKVYPKVAEGEIVKSYDVIYKGDLLKPYASCQPVFEQRSHPKVKAYILATQSGSTEIGSPEIVYIDAGQKQGLKPGQILEVYREEGDGIPPLKLGQIAVVLTTPSTATAMVLKSNYAFHIGDVVK